LVQPYDRGKLECAYGPLHLESREGHSFTRNPVLIVDYAQPVKAEAPPPVPLEKPTVAPPPEPQVEPLPPAPKTLPKTSGELPLLALAGVIAIGTSIVRSRL
jgi:hypothetical protein